MPGVEVGYAKSFGANVTMLAQQRGSRLRGAVDVETGLFGTEAFFDQVGDTEGQEITVRYGDTPNNEVEEDRRRVAPTPWDWGKLFDTVDKAKRLTDPTDQYTMAAGYHFGRHYDDQIITALGGTAYTGQTGTTAVTLPTTQKIAVASTTGSNTGMDLGKLIKAKGLFGVNDVDIDDPANELFLVISQKQLDNMLDIEELTSSDYMIQKSIATGEITQVLGMKVIRTERLALSAATDIRSCFAFARSGLKLGIWFDAVAEIGKNPQKKYMWQAYYRSMSGATRMEEKKVVQIECDETP